VTLALTHGPDDGCRDYTGERLGLHSIDWKLVDTLPPVRRAGLTGIQCCSTLGSGK
jgi:hypothetical protein